MLALSQSCLGCGGASGVEGISNHRTAVHLYETFIARNRLTHNLCDITYLIFTYGPTCAAGALLEVKMAKHYGDASSREQPRFYGNA